MAPPSELACGVSKRATTNFANPSPWKVTCGIQAVAIEPPRVSAAKRVDTASIAPSRGSVALLSHRSRIIQASVSDFRSAKPITSGRRSLSMRYPRHVAVVAVLIAAAQPISTAAQPVLAGVVTLLQGSVTATRTSAPEPVQLQLRDGVFSDERIATGENGFARILLCGKAIVTMQERSSLQVAEDLGTSTLVMSDGRIAVAVARELTKTGELIEIKTPTALAASRGAVVIAGITNGVTTFTVVRGPTGRFDRGSMRVMLRANQQVTIPAKGLLR